MTSWVMIDQGERLGIVLRTDDGGTELLYLTRDLDKRILEFFNAPDDLPDGSVGISLLAGLPNRERKPSE